MFIEDLILEFIKPFIPTIIEYLPKNAKDFQMIITILYVVASTTMLIMQKRNYEKYIKSLYLDLFEYEQLCNNAIELCKKVEAKLPILETSVASLLNEYDTLKELVKEKDCHIKFLKKYSKK